MGVCVKISILTEVTPVKEEDEDTKKLTYWATKVLYTACPQQKVRDYTHIIISKFACLSRD